MSGTPSVLAVDGCAVRLASSRVGRPLRLDLEGLRSARRGDHRVLFQIDDDAGTVTIVTIDHRADVYRRRSEHG